MPTLKTTVDEDIKQLFISLATRSHQTEAQLLRQLVLEKIENLSPGGAESKNEIPSQESERVTFRMPSFLKRTAVRRAKAKGMTINAWLAGLTTTALLREPVMSHNELGALHASQRELAAIGRNINQIARALNERPGDESAIRKNDLAALRESLNANRLAIRRIVRVSLQSWGEDDL